MLPGRPRTGPGPAAGSACQRGAPGTLSEMAESISSMMEPPIEDLLSQVDSRFTLVTLAAKRGRQINAYFNQLGEGLGTIAPPQVPSGAHKPLSISFEEIAAGKVGYRRVEEPAEEPSVTPEGIGREAIATEIVLLDEPGEGPEA